MKILIIDDDMWLTDAINHELKETHEINYAADGEAGLKIALKKRFDLIILDLLAPGKGGLSVLTKLRKQRNSTPVLMMVAADSVRDIILCLDSGASTCITKPFEIQTLIARVKAVIRRNQLGRSEAHRNAHTSFDEVVCTTEGDLPVANTPPIQSVDSRRT